LMEYRFGTRFRVDARGRTLPPPGMAEAARLYSAGQLEAAASCCEAVLADEPTHFEAHHLLGVVSLDLGRQEAALAALQRAVALNPRSPRAQYHLGNAFQASSRHAEAEPCYRTALALAPDYAEPQNNLGNTLRSLGRHEEAIDCYQAALGHRADDAPAFYNMALSLTDLGRLDEAETALRAALSGQVKPKEAHRLADVRDALAMVLVEMGRDAEALEAIRLNTAHPRAEWNEALMLLRMGRLREAWPKYERRWVLPGFRDDVEAPAPAVLALDQVAGKRVLLRGEQGRGDIIQFARYAPLLARRGADVTLAVFPDLVRLMHTLVDVAVIDTDTAPPGHDVEAALLSLPFAFGTDLESIPVDIPYLSADPSLRAAWAERLGPRSAPRVGLCWWGSQHIPERSIALPVLAPLLAVQGVAFHAVRTDITEEDRAFSRLTHHADALADFAETAALLSHMDLVITIDTAVAHLAGAMGLPVWVLLRRSADWRWLRERDDSPWYPTIRLFRQDARGEWESVVAAVARELIANPPVAASGYCPDTRRRR
ncbi:MAG: tetratricopeptide repeat-containing glycosyltransferase family protein, partial [Acetobacteraceae bacterium]